MIVGFCKFHNRYINKRMLKTHRCKCKENTGERCRHLELFPKNSKYKNAVRYVGRKVAENDEY